MTYLNLGCGKVTMPAPKPAHHALIPDEVYQVQDWLNVDKNAGGGIVTMDLFQYPFKLPNDTLPIPSDTFDGALISHLVEHIPHDTRGDYQHLPDGFYAFFAELWRVMRNGAIAHILCPYGLSSGAMQDPTHTRLIVPTTFTYLTPNPDAPFEMEYGSHWEIVSMTLGLTEWGHTLHHTGASPERFFDAVDSLYVGLRCVK